MPEKFMNKKILVVYYSQTGQLKSIIDSFLAPFFAAEVEVDIVRIEPETDYPFPWSAERFFKEMPPSVLGEPCALKPFQFPQTGYDLVILGWQPWFLSPSVPTTSLVKHPAFKALLKNTPLITLSGTRNMWLNAQEKLKPLLKEAGTNWVGNIVLMDKNPNFVSGITILYWMLYGKKDRLWGIFPRPGVSDADIAGADIFGETVLNALGSSDWPNLQPKLIGQGAMHVRWNLMFIEKVAGKLFAFWAKLISTKKERAPWLVLFKYYLLIALFIVAPIVVTINRILIKPFQAKKIEKRKQYFQQLN